MLEELKRVLKITWEDEDEEEELNRLLLTGQTKLNSIIGENLDFEADFEAKELLFNYCRYAYNNAVEMFEENFRSDILRLQLNAAIKVDDV